jgi:hypothetical protein
MTDNINLIYIGRDLSYWEKIITRYKEVYPDLNFHFSDIFQSDKEKIKTIRQDLLELKPHIIYLDYSSNEPEMIRLANNIRRDSGTIDTVVVGLLDNIDSRRSLMISLASGVYLNVIKSNEISSLIHHPMTAAFPEIAKDLEYALAIATFDAKASTICSIQYVTEKYLHIESKLDLEIGSMVSIDTNLMISPALLSNYKIIDKMTSDLFTNFSFAYNIEYIHQDNTLEVKAKEKIKSLEEKLTDNPKDKNLKYDLMEAKSALEHADKDEQKLAKDRDEALKMFIQTNMSYGLKAKPRVLVYDSQLQLLSESKQHLDSHPFSCRIHSKYIPEEQCSIIKTAPGIIAIQLDYPEESTIDSKEEKSKDDKRKDCSKFYFGF